MITDFLKSMSPVDPNPPPRVPYIWCGEVGCGEVGCGVWGVGCGKWGEKSRLLSPVSCLLNPDS